MKHEITTVFTILETSRFHQSLCFRAPIVAELWSVFSRTQTQLQNSFHDEPNRNPHCADPGESSLSDDDDASDALFWLAPKATACPLEFTRCPVTQIAPVSPPALPDLLEGIRPPDEPPFAPVEKPLPPESKPRGPWQILQDRLSKLAPRGKRGRPKGKKNRTEIKLLAEDEMKGMEVDEVTAPACCA